VPVNTKLTCSELSREEFDRLARDCQTVLAQTPGVELGPHTMVPAPGHRGDTVTLGSFALALVTSGAVTVLFNTLKSYVERGVEASFEGVDRKGKSVKFNIKGATSEQFRTFLHAAGILK
jgi:hypothetical protein